MITYEVEDYSVSKLGELLNRHSHKGDGYSEAKSHLSYFDEYFTSVGAKTILIEHPYTDRDYLEDFAAYYARCHADYGKRCARLHFFGSRFDRVLISKAVEGEAAAVKTLQTSYLGFVVVKPLPSTVIGRTCLVTYGNVGRERAFPTTRIYKVHIFGIELSVESLPFQEQDTDVAACATSALWSVFNATGHLFQHHIPSPAEITKAAAASQRLVNRTLPAGDGLTAEQMADAIRSVGLEPLYISAKNLDLLLIGATAYLRARIPCLLMGAIHECIPGSPARRLGHHAIALAGFGEPKGPAVSYDSTLFSAPSTTRLYAHDDQVGPFSRIQIDRTRPHALLTSWIDQNKLRGNVFFEPEILLVPLYHKIRVPITSVISTLVALDRWLETARQATVLSLADQIEWDIVLTENSDFKSDIFGDTSIVSGFREKILEDDLPRYIWRVNAMSGGQRLFDLLFDATDLLQGGHIMRGVPYSKSACLSIAVLAKNPAARSYIKLTGNRGLEMALRWFADNAPVF
jgi:hypothetical protein